MQIAIGCDDAALELKGIIKAFLVAQGHQVDDFGIHEQRPAFYADIALAVSKSILDGRNERAILICGTGIGMAISANKVRGIRAAQCHDTYSAERASKSNNAQVITMGSRVIGPELAKSIAAAFLASTFQAGASTAKVARISEIETLFEQTPPPNSSTRLP